jgi:biopolymer transport protein ExbD
MGIPEHAHRRSNSAGGVFVILAALLIAGLAAAAVLAVLGVGFWTVHSDGPTAIPATPDFADEMADAPPDLTVEVDRQGRTYLNGQATPLDDIQATFEQRMRHGVSADSAQIHFEEGCPFEHVDKARDMFRRLGFQDPQMTSVPPRRQVAVSLDAEGNASIDGESAEDVRRTLQEIAQRHGRRATVHLQVDPQCPAEAVSAILAHCNHVGLGAVNIEANETAESAN